MDLAGKVAIVTGGSQGIGKAISSTFLKAGMKVVICDVNESAAESFLKEIPDDLKPNVIFQKCDVSSLDNFKAAFEKAKSAFGKIDVLMNNAGIMSEKEWKRMIEINVVGVINGIHLAFEFMGKNNGGSGGSIINTASNAGLCGFDVAPVYSCTKHGVVGLTRSYGTEYHYEKTGITVNAVCPGPIFTSMLRSFPRLCLDEERGSAYNIDLTALSPDEVANGVVKLLKDGKNGALLRIDKSIGVKYVEE